MPVWESDGGCDQLIYQDLGLSEDKTFQKDLKALCMTVPFLLNEHK